MYSEVLFVANRKGPKEFRISPLALRLVPLAGALLQHTILFGGSLVFSNFLAPETHHLEHVLEIDFKLLFTLVVCSLNLHFYGSDFDIDLLVMAETRPNDESRSWALILGQNLNKHLYELECRIRTAAGEFGTTRCLNHSAAQILTSGKELELCFAVYWDFQDYCNKNLSGSREISRVPILVGRLGDAFAGTCGEYFELTWPQEATSLLDFLEKEFKQNQESGKWYKLPALAKSLSASDARVYDFKPSDCP